MGLSYGNKNATSQNVGADYTGKACYMHVRHGTRLRKELTQLRGAQLRMRTTALKLPHIWTESAAEHAKRVRRSVRQVRESNGLGTWEQLRRQRQWAFAEHMCTDDADELLTIIVKWKGAEWLQKHRECTGSQGHGWHLRPWRWEEQFSTIWKKRGMSC